MNPLFVNFVLNDATCLVAQMRKEKDISGHRRVKMCLVKKVSMMLVFITVFWYSW